MQSQTTANTPVTALGEDWRIIESLLPVGWSDKARELGAFRRARGFTTPRALLQTLLIHLADGCGLRQTALLASQAGIAHVSDVALLKRLKSSERWFEWMSQQLRARLAPREPLSPPADSACALLGKRRVRVVDGSVISEPGPTGSHWRLHYAIGLPGLDCQEVLVSPRSTGETFKRFNVLPGDLFMADRGYAHPGGIAHVTSQGGDVLVRLNLVTLPLYEPGSKQRCCILARARTLAAGQAGAWPVAVRPKEGSIITGQLCAVRKSAQAAAKARVRVQRESQRNGAQLQPQTLEAADYVFVFTTLAQTVSAQQVLDVYRLRWQVELEFKRLKSLVNIGHLKKHDAQAARSWLQGKLLVALLTSALIAHAERFSPWGFDFAGVG
jgi:hypothetical protein